MKKINLYIILVVMLFSLNISCNEEVSDDIYEFPQASRLRFVTAAIDGRVEIGWNENKDPNFYTYELYRSDKLPVTRESDLIFKTQDRLKLDFVDLSLKSASIYYYRLYTINDNFNSAAGTEYKINIPEITAPGIFGFISKDEVWDLKMSPIIIKGDITINEGVMLKNPSDFVAKLQSLLSK
jgi:hypothetical protein